MTQPASQLLNQALRLSLEERELLAVELMTHLHADDDSLADVEAAWHVEIKRRAAASDTLSDSVPFEDAWARISTKHA
jgi:hypothetical protein